MKSNNNRSLIFITLSGDEHAALSLFIKKPMHISVMVRNVSFQKIISTRIMNLIGFIDKHSDPQSAIVEPPFLWSPYFVPRSDIQINMTKYINIGDSFFNGNPMVGNGLGFHLREINKIFN